MKRSEKLEHLSRTTENDMKAWTYHFQANRHRRFEFFIDCLPSIKEQTNVIERENESYTFTIPELGKCDLYPKSNKVLIRSKNKWVTNGFQFIVKKLKLTI